MILIEMKAFKMGFEMFPEENVSLILVKIIQILEKWLKGILKTYDRFPKIDFQ